jgi:hypothetical protein
MPPERGVKLPLKCITIFGKISPKLILKFGQNTPQVVASYLSPLGGRTGWRHRLRPSEEGAHPVRCPSAPACRQPRQGFALSCWTQKSGLFSRKMHNLLSGCLDAAWGWGGLARRRDRCTWPQAKRPRPHLWSGRCSDLAPGNQTD